MYDIQITSSQEWQDYQAAVRELIEVIDRIIEQEEETRETLNEALELLNA